MRQLYGLKITLVNFCWYRCKYCFVDTDDTTMMSHDFFKKIVDYYVIQVWETKRFFFLWWEVLMFFDAFKESIEYIQKTIWKKKAFIYLVTSGLTLTDEKAKFLSDNNIALGISIDGDKKTHSFNRVDKQGKETFSATIAAIEKLNTFYDDTNLWYTITVDQSTMTCLFENFLYLSSLDNPSRNISIAAVCKDKWSREQIKDFWIQLQKICNYIIENISLGNYYYYNILWFFIEEISFGRHPGTYWNLEIHAFPNEEVSSHLFFQSKWKNKSYDPNYLRFGVVIPYAERIIELSKENEHFNNYISTLPYKAIF